MPVERATAADLSPLFTQVPGELRIEAGSVEGALIASVEAQYERSESSLSVSYLKDDASWRIEGLSSPGNVRVCVTFERNEAGLDRQCETLRVRGAEPIAAERRSGS